MKNKKTKILMFIIGIIIVFFFASVFIYKTVRKPVATVDLSCERFIPANPSILIRFDNLSSVWMDFKGTNFYYQLKNFSQWFLEEMPSESLGFSKDIKDIQADIGFELDEKNILSIFGRRVLVAMWLENIDDKKILMISNLNNREKMKNLIARKNDVNKYRNISVGMFGEGKYWCLIEDKLVISNDIGTIRKVIDLVEKVTDISFVNDDEFKKNITKIVSQNYVYINPSRLKFKKYDLTKNEISSVLLSIKFEKGILVRSYISQKNQISKQTPRKIESLSFIPDNTSLFVVGNFAALSFFSSGAAGEGFVSDELGYALFPFMNKNAIMVFCEVKNKKLFLDKFERAVGPVLKDKEGGVCNYTLPFFGLTQFRYFFVKDYFIICSPISFSESIRDFMAKKKPLLSDTNGFKQLNIPSKVNNILYVDFSGIFSNVLKKDYIDFIRPNGGYTIGDETVYHIPMLDLDKSQWEKIFSEIHRLISKKIIVEKERLSRKNLFYIRDALNVYNAKTNKYPNKLNSLIEEYMDELPQELLTKSNKVSSEMNGSGGWFYKNNKVQLNVFGIDVYGNYYTQW